MVRNIHGPAPRRLWRAGSVVLFSLAIVAAATTSVAATDRAPTPPPAPLRDTVLLGYTVDPAAVPPGTAVNVEVHGPDLAAVRAAIDAAGGHSYGEVVGHLVEAAIPVGALQALAADPAVDRVARLTRSSSGPAPADAALQIGSPLSAVVEDTLQLRDWHEAGHRGAGQKIGILDLFGATELDDAIAAGRLPPPAGAFCLRQGEPCNITELESAPHGVGVAEIAHAAAPEADLYLATVHTLSDLSAAVDWFAGQGVTIINRSETSEFDGPGDGTGPVGSIVDRAIAADMVWVAAAGNAAGSESRLGENWIGDFNDTNGDGIHEFADGNQMMEFGCGFLLGMRWDDWDPLAIATDYDLWIFDEPTDLEPRALANNLQRLPADPPLEHIDPGCAASGDPDYLMIQKFDDLQPDGVDRIQIMGNFTPFGEWVNPESATGPGAESANPGAVTVGATVRPAMFTLAPYSSRGPTTDGRLNPDLVGPSCLPVDNFPGCFSGTSASAPFVSGTLAVLRGAGVFTAAIEADELIPRITADQGQPGPDSDYGHGALSLPPPSEFGVLPITSLCQGLQPTLIGTDGNDILEGTDEADVILGGAGRDVIAGRGGPDVICGGEGRDVIRGGPGNDSIDGGPQRDRIWGQQGADTIRGGPGGDRLFGNVGFDEIRGEGGNDIVIGGYGNDELRGGAGRDTLVGSPGDDTLVGGVSTDACWGERSGEPAGAGDRLSRCEN